MKHKYLFLSLFMAGAGALSAQQARISAPDIMDKNQNFEVATHDVASRFVFDAPIVNVTGPGDTLWYSDFETVSDWTFANQGTFGWDIVTSANETGWFLNTLNSTSGGNRAEMNNGDPGANENAARQHIMRTTNPIDVSTVTGSTILMYQQRTWRFLDQYHIEASNDGTNWVEIGDNDHILSSTAFNNTTGSADNPEYMAYYIPASISGAGNNSLWVRFRWNDLNDDGVAYGWLIDDVVIYRGAASDLEIQQTYYLGATDSNAFQKYTQIPARQGDNSNFVLAAAISNRGDVAQTNVVMTANATGVSYTAATPAATLANDELVIDEVAGGVFQTNGVGNYSIDFTVANGGGAELIDINNTSTWDFTVTDNIWAYDNEEAQAASWYGDAGYTICVYYDHFEDDTITGIIPYFPEFAGNAGDFGLTYGEVVGAFIYNTALDQVLGENGFYTVSGGTTGDFVDDWVTIPLNVPVTGAIDGYYACLRTYNDEIPFGLNWDSPDGLSFVDPDNAGQWFNPITTTADTHTIYPMIRVKTTDPDACLGINITLTGLVTDILAVEPFEGDVDLTVSGNGTGTLSYEWTGPNGFSASTEDIDGLDTKGLYTVVVTDIDGCSGTESFDVQGNIGVNTLTSESLNVYPNPANDQLTVAFGVAGNFNVELVNLKGELVSSRQINTSAGNTVNFDVAELPAGVYAITVFNESEKITKEIVIK